MVKLGARSELQSTDPGSISPLAGQVDSAVSEIEALRQGLEEADQAVPRTDIR